MRPMPPFFWGFKAASQRGGGRFWVDYTPLMLVWQTIPINIPTRELEKTLVPLTFLLVRRQTGVPDPEKTQCQVLPDLKYDYEVWEEQVLFKSSATLQHCKRERHMAFRPLWIFSGSLCPQADFSDTAPRHTRQSSSPDLQGSELGRGARKYLGFSDNYWTNINIWWLIIIFPIKILPFGLPSGYLT